MSWVRIVVEYEDAKRASAPEAADGQSPAETSDTRQSAPEAADGQSPAEASVDQKDFPEPSSIWSTFDRGSAFCGPSLLVTRDGKRIVERKRFEANVTTGSWQALVSAVLYLAVRHVEEEVEEEG